MSAPQPKTLSYETLRAIYRKFNPNAPAIPHDEEIYAMFHSVCQEKNLLPEPNYEQTIASIIELVGMPRKQPTTYMELDSLYSQIPTMTPIYLSEFLCGPLSEDDHPSIKLTDGYFPGSDDLLELIRLDDGKPHTRAAITVRLQYNPTVVQKHLLYCRTRAVADLLLRFCSIVKPEHSSEELRYVLALLRGETDDAEYILRNARPGKNEKAWFRWVNGQDSTELREALGGPRRGVRGMGSKRRRLVGVPGEEIKIN